MQKKEETMCSFTQKGTRLQMVKLTIYDINNPKSYKPNLPLFKYQLRLNRKIIKTSTIKFIIQKLFAQYCQNIVLQLKIF